MPTPSLPQIDENASQKQIVDYVTKLQRDLDWLLQNLDDLNVRRIRADSIFTGTLDANIVTIRSDLTSGFIQIDGNGMVVNNGAYNTFEVDLSGNVSMTSARIRSASGYPYVELNYDGNLIAAYSSEDDYIEVTPFSTNSRPAINFIHGGVATGVIEAPEGLVVNGIFGLTLQSGTDPIYLTTESLDGIRFDSFGEIRSIDDGGASLLDIFAKSGDDTADAGAHNHGIAPGTKLALDGGGFVTWVAANDHSHTQN